MRKGRGEMILYLLVVAIACILLGLHKTAQRERHKRQCRRAAMAAVRFANGGEDEHSFARFWRGCEIMYGTMTREEVTDLYFLQRRDSILEFADVSILLSYRAAVRAGFSPEEVH